MPQRKLLDVPLEVLVDILFFLPYFDLVRCKSICKTFQTALKDPALDDALFRTARDGNHSRVSPKVKTGVHQLHPVFAKLSYTYTMGGVGNFGQDGNKLRKLGENHPLLAESAVIPPVTELRCIPHRPGKRLGSRLQNPAGVTVGQIFKYFVSYFKPQGPFPLHLERYRWYTKILTHVVPVDEETSPIVHITFCRY